ncbi:hypothetical protein HYX09_03605 [Candidatus Woesearchaeota archaeon]|nr:hypothetical protein [Candidatus Woesearchaeota archaeon]
MSITKLAEKYVQEHPSVKDCLKNDLVNFSSLSRKIARESGLNVKKDFDAILIACRRFQYKLRKEHELEKKILEILKKSKIEIKNKIISVVLEKDVFFGNLINLEKEAKKRNDIFRIIEGVSAITIITSEDFLELINKYFRNKTTIVNKGLAEITIKSPKEIHVTPGVYAYLCSLFGENNINIIGTLSCWTDTIFLINDGDAGKVINLMKF